MEMTKTEDRIIEVRDVRLGGAPGENPTVLIGSLFYRKSPLILDEYEGKFDKSRAEELLAIQDELSDITGNPAMLDIEGSTSSAVENYIDFVAERTDAPLLLGGPTPEMRTAILDIVKEGGLKDRVIYNSLMPGCSKEEVEAILEAGLDTAVLLGYTFSDLSPQGRVDALTRLKEETEKLGLSNTLLDTFVMDVPSLGIAFSALKKVKKRLGLPAGCGPHNAIGMWRGLRRKMKVKSRSSIVASVNAFAAASGADFLLYGPIENARDVFPAVSMVDAAYGFKQIQDGKRLSRDHPLFKIA